MANRKMMRLESIGIRFYRKHERDCCYCGGFWYGAAGMSIEKRRNPSSFEKARRSEGWKRGRSGAETLSSAPRANLNNLGNHRAGAGRAGGGMPTVDVFALVWTLGWHK